MKIKIVKLVIIFIVCMPFYVCIDFITSILISGKFDMKNAFIYSTAFAFAWTSIVGYRWFKSYKKENKDS